MKNLFAVSLMLIFIFSLSNCGEPSVVKNISTRTERIPVELTEDDLFKGNKIMAFLENEIKFLQQANELFLKGLNSFRNEKDLDSAHYYLQNSILAEPSAKAYFELANVYMDKKEYPSALLAFGVAEQLNYEPFSKILYNKACLYSMQEEEAMAAKYLEFALQAGYNNIEHINKDEDLDKLRKTRHYNKAIEKGLRGMSDGENLFFLQFKKMFAIEDVPLELKVNMKEAYQEELKTISYDYEKYISEMRDEEFSREVSKEFYYYARPYEKENFVALIYIVSDVFMGDYAPLTYRMVTFTHGGKLIDKREISGRDNLSDPIMEASLNKNMTIDVKLLMPTYQEDTDDFGYYDNPVLSTELVGTKRFRLTKKGKIIEEESVDLTMN